jgi:glucose/arabinose dehydrogenase
MSVPLIRILAVCSTMAAFAAAAATTAAAAPRVETVATGLEIPWEIAFLPDGRALVTERPGRVRLLDRRGRLRRKPIARLPVAGYGEGGLLGIAVDPRFRRNRYVYLYRTTTRRMQLERRRLVHGRLVGTTSLIHGIRSGAVHDSGRIAFGPGRRLYVSTGDAGEGALAQDPHSLNGKLLTLAPRQYHSRGHAVPRVLATGLRNSQGFDWQPRTGRLLATDHGPSGFDGPEGYDEVDQIVPGGNFGWPSAIGNDTAGGRFLAPLRLYVAPVAPSGATFVRGRSRWRGDFLFATLRGEALHRLVLRGGRVVRDQALFAGRFGRLRTVVEGPCGCLYVLTSNRDGRGAPLRGDDRILRIEPPGSRRRARRSCGSRSRQSARGSEDRRPSA